MRVNTSAMGSLRLIVGSFLPARLDHAGDLAVHGGLTQLVTTEAEFAIHTARTAGDLAAIAHPRRARVARQRLQRKTRLVALFVGLRLVVDDRLQGGTPGGELLHRAGALHLAVDQRNA